MFRDVYLDKTKKEEMKHRIQQSAFPPGQAEKWVLEKAHRKINDIANILFQNLCVEL